MNSDASRLDAATAPADRSQVWPRLRVGLAALACLALLLAFQQVVSSGVRQAVVRRVAAAALADAAWRCQAPEGTRLRRTCPAPDQPAPDEVNTAQAGADLPVLSWAGLLR